MKLNADMFKDVVIYTVAEPNSMGHGMEFMDKDGNAFALDYTSEESPYEEIKRCFPALKDCHWNGPMTGEERVEGELVLGGDAEPTRVADGWRHFYTGYGTHVVVQEKYYRYFRMKTKGLGGDALYEQWKEQGRAMLKLYQQLGGDDVTVIEAGQAAREEHGEAYGGQLVKLTTEELDALQKGKQLAINIMSGEYVLFLEGPAAR